MSERTNSMSQILLPVAVAIGFLLLWAGVYAMHLYPESIFPSPQAVGQAFLDDVKDGSLFKDIIASLFRVACGFTLSMLVGVPLGLGLGISATLRTALLPTVNFLRNLSPVAWIPFSILWFGIGDPPTIFLIFMSATFPLSLSTAAAVANIPKVYFRVAKDYGITGKELLTQVMLPAIMPQVITALRVTFGICWVVLVAAEMIAGQNGLGYLIWDARNGLRWDRLVSAMLVLGTIGVLTDRLFRNLTQLPSVRWGYER